MRGVLARFADWIHQQETALTFRQGLQNLGWVPASTMPVNPMEPVTQFVRRHESPSEFLSCDWGTTQFRLRHVRTRDLAVLAQFSSSEGVKSLRQSWSDTTGPDLESRYAAFLSEKVNRFVNGDPALVSGMVVSGMASSTVGWRELPYAGLPFPLDGSGILVERIGLTISPGKSIPVLLVSGVADTNGMMRGEETELVGLFRDSSLMESADSLLVILPGTHSKHVVIRNRAVIGFQTFLTGELFEVLAKHSLLSVSVESADDSGLADDSESLDGFLAGVREAASSGLPRSLFAVRARHVLRKLAPRSNRWFLSGLLIGSELVDGLKSFPEGPVLLHSAEPLRTAYRFAARELGVENRFIFPQLSDPGLPVLRAHAQFLELESAAGGRS